MALDSILRVLQSPTKFFDQQIGEPPHLRFPALIVVVFMACRVSANYILFRKLTGQLPPNLAVGMDWMQFGFGVMLIGVAIADIIFWIVGTGILTCGNILLDGDGEYRKLLELTVFCHAPVLLFGIAVLIFSIVYTPKIDFDEFSTVNIEALEKTDRQRHEETMTEIKSRFLSEVDSTKFKILGSAATCAYLWLALLVLQANARTFRLPLSKSFISVLGVIALYVVIAISRQKFFPGAI